MTREELLMQLMALDFAAIELQLYMNTHPRDKRGLDKYNQTVLQAAQVRAEFEREFGPLTSFRSVNEQRWKWIDDPWPWNRCYYEPLT